MQILTLFDSHISQIWKLSDLEIIQILTLFDSKYIQILKLPELEIIQTLTLFYSEISQIWKLSGSENIQILTLSDLEIIYILTLSDSEMIQILIIQISFFFLDFILFLNFIIFTSEKKIKKTDKNLNKRIYCSLSKQSLINQQLLSYALPTKVNKKYLQENLILKQKALLFGIISKWAFYPIISNIVHNLFFSQHQSRLHIF